jgi:cell division protein FtsA
MIDMGGGTTDVLAYIEGSPYHTEVLPIGGDQVTSDLSILLKTPLEAAEKIKRDSGCCYMDLIHNEETVTIPGVGGRPPVVRARREIVEITQPRMTEMLNLAKEQVEDKGYLKMLGGGVVLTGGGALLEGTVELAQEVFELPARIGYPTRLGGLTEEVASPIYATGLGLVLYGLSRSAVEPGERRRKNAGVFDKMRNWLKEFF